MIFYWIIKTVLIETKSVKNMVYGIKNGRIRFCAKQIITHYDDKVKKMVKLKA